MEGSILGGQYPSTAVCIDHMYSCFQMMDVAGEEKCPMEAKPPPLANTRSKKTSILLIISQVFEKLSVFMVRMRL